MHLFHIVIDLRLNLIDYGGPCFRCWIVAIHLENNSTYQKPLLCLVVKTKQFLRVPDYPVTVVKCKEELFRKGCVCIHERE